jgi:hypothetical protein
MISKERLAFPGRHLLVNKTIIVIALFVEKSLLLPIAIAFEML